MSLGDGQPEQRATIEGSGKLRKEKTVKIRMDATELLLLDNIGRKLGFAERATTLRELMRLFPQMEQADRIVVNYKLLKNAQATFNAVADSK